MLLEFFMIFDANTSQSFIQGQAEYYAKPRAEFRNIRLDYVLTVERHEALDRPDMHGYRITLNNP